LSKYHSYLNSAKQILGSYHGEEPFAAALKKFFAANKKIGSTDRKQISQLCYSYFRLGKAIPKIPVDERILTGYFLSTSGKGELMKGFNSGYVPPAFPVNEVFPWQDKLSEGIDHGKFCTSFFTQPDLFIRIRPGNENAVLAKLENAGLKFEQVTPNCIALPNSTRIENIIEINKEAVIQDYGSQQIANLFPALKPKSSVWDCCAASGGKSLLLYDTDPSIDLTVSDIRESILSNLTKRFKEAGIKNYKSFVADITAPGFKSQAGKFDLIIADVPCTGSGTWGRTPEQLFHFNTDKINEYATRQKKIVANIIPSLKPKGYLLYITCSVFKKENEEAVAAMQDAGLTLVNKSLLKGYERKADTLFAALLQK
jgi:16S rRNA (cytosine967-C5)-methyltransferase